MDYACYYPDVSIFLPFLLLEYHMHGPRLEQTRAMCDHETIVTFYKHQIELLIRHSSQWKG